MDSPSHAASSRTYDDTAVRRRIGPWSGEGVPDLSAFEPDTTFFVRAAAGSGKTTALVARMVALVRSTTVSVEDLTAITFTRKAAGEMNARFFRELRRARRAVPDDTTEARRLDQALSNAQRTFIGTIHSFCARLLREQPVAAGVPPDFVAGLEEREERELRDRAWRRYLQSVYEETPERIEEITRLGVEPGDLEASFETLCRYPELDPFTRAPDQVPDLEGAVEATRRRLDRWQSLRPDSLPKGRDDMMRAFDKAEKMLRFQDLEAPAQQAAFLALLDDLVRDGEVPNRTCKVTYWGDAQAEAETLRDDAVPALVEETIRPALRPWRAYVHEKVMAFVRPAVQAFQRLRRDEGRLTFHDLLLQTRRLLRDHPDVRRAVQEQYPRLLVDEFQDTDPLQAEILFYLASRDPTETDWRACRPRPGSLFIVGDDKQSIYRFRRADKETFDEVGRLVEGAGGEAVDLTKNFRSVGRICDWCDRAFSDLFSAPDVEDLQAEYVPFDPQRPDGGDTALRRIEVEKVPWNRGEDVAAADARQIARFIRGALDGRIDDAFYGDSDDGAVFSGEADPSDFLILTRRKKRLSVYAEALSEHDLPYVVTGSEDLGASAALKALVDLMTCALRPDDPVACVAYLKGPLAGCSDHDLYRYQRAGGSFDRMDEPVPEDVTERLDDGVCERVVGALRRLRDARKHLRDERSPVALQRIVDTFGVLAGAAHPDPDGEGPDASLRAGAVLRVLAIVRSLAAQGHGWAEVLEELQRVVDGEQTVDGLTLETGQTAAVRLMNAHQAKGLEARVVFLADPYGAGGGSPSITKHVRRNRDELVAPVVQGEDYYRRVTHSPLGWHDESDSAFRALEERHERAEERRLLYVAATRARNLLIVSTYPEKSESGPWAPLYPFLDAADVPVLDSPSVTTEEPGEVPAPPLDAGREARHRKIEAGRRPSYEAATVTGEQKDARYRLGDGADGDGSSFGTAVHALFEHCVAHRHSVEAVRRSTVGRALEEAGAEASEAQIDRGADAVHSFLRSALWVSLKDAPQAYAEYPIAQFQRGAPSTLLRGVIDMVYRNGDSWTLIDVKTDRVTADTVRDLPDDHAYVRQVQAYAGLWTQVTGAPVGRAGIWWTALARFTPVGRAGPPGAP